MKIKYKQSMDQLKEWCRASMIVHDNPLFKCMSLFVIGLVFTAGVVLDNYNIAIFAIGLHWIYNIWYFLGNVKERVLFFIINLSMFLFLISRPVVSLFRGNEWWYFQDATIWKALLSLMLVLFFLNIGYCHIDGLIVWIRKLRGCKNEKSSGKRSEKQFFSFNRKWMMGICLGLFFIGILAFAYQELPKSIYALSHDYVDLFGKYTDSTPFYIRIFATMMPYFLCGYLVCFPEKRKAFLPLAVYVISGLPGLVSGARNDIMIKLVFVFMYYCLRDVVKEGKDIWLGKIEQMLIIVLIPIMIIGLSVLNYAREGTDIKKNDGNLLVEFFYLQGTSFDTVCQGFEYEDELTSSEYVVSYTFGSFIDYVKHGTASQILFGAEDLGSGNSYKMATKSNKLAHHLSYQVLNKSYLYGHGRGSSFIIETYLDFGFLGLIFYTLLLGGGLRLAPRLLMRGWLTKVITLLVLSNIFLVTRGEALGMLNFIITFQFWIAVVMMAGSYVAVHRLRLIKR